MGTHLFGSPWYEASPRAKTTLRKTKSGLNIIMREQAADAEDKALLEEFKLKRGAVP